MRYLLILVALLSYQSVNALDFDVTKVLADQGDATAQYNLGNMYANGDGVQKNKIRAYVWLSRAQALGDEKAAGNIDILKSDMSPEQIKQAQALVTECYESNFKNCE
jgi:TPR repeat protein